MFERVTDTKVPKMKIMTWNVSKQETI